MIHKTKEVIQLQIPPIWEGEVDDRLWYYHIQSQSVVEFIAEGDLPLHKETPGIIFNYRGIWLGKFQVNNCQKFDQDENEVIWQAWLCFKDLLKDWIPMRTSLLN